MTRDHRSGPGTVRNEDSRQNVVLVTIDSLRADHCGFLGSEYDLTPTLDRLAADGLSFETAIAPGPRTPSSMPVAFTGHFDRQRDVSWSDWWDRWIRIAEHLERHRTIAERLRAAGYTTVGVTVNPWTHDTGFDTGFDRFLELKGAEEIEGADTGSTVFQALDWILERTEIGDTYQWGDARDWFVQWPHYYDRVLELVHDVEEPYFLWVFLLDPHQPYLASREYRSETSAPAMYYANIRERITGSPDELSSRIRTWLERSYRDAIRSTDAFLDALQTDLADDDPTVVVHADHGEAFGEHGTYGHEEALYEENLHVPLVVANSATSGAVQSPVSLRSLPRLIEQLATAELVDPGTVTQAHVVATTEGVQSRGRALRGRRWKYITDGDRRELYDIRSDPNEAIDRADERSELVDELDRVLHARLRRDIEVVEIGRAIDAIDLHDQQRQGVSR